MKKFLSIIILSIIFISATLPCAFADAFDNEVCYVSEDESTIEYNNKTYILIDTQDEYVLSDVVPLKSNTSLFKVNSIFKLYFSFIILYG